MTDTLTIDRSRAGVVVLQLNRPHQLNAINEVMRERGRGWVPNVTSVGGEMPDGPPFSDFDRTAGFGVYGTVKAALNRMTKSLAAERRADAQSPSQGHFRAILRLLAR